MRTYTPAKSSSTVRKSKLTKGLSYFQRYSRLWMTFMLMLSDIMSLFLAGFLALGLRNILGGGIQSLEYYIRLIPLVFVFLGIYAWRGLYPAVGLSPVEELRRLTESTSAVFLLVTAFSFWTRSGEIYSRLFFAFSWILMLIIVQFNRWILRVAFIQLGLWGEPVAIVGYGPQGQRIIEFLQHNLHLGLNPTVVIDGFDDHEELIVTIPKLKLGDPEAESEHLRNAGIRTAILLTSEMPEYLLDAIIDNQRFGFTRLILMSELSRVGGVGIYAHDLLGYLGLEVRQNLLNPWQRVFKRIMDITIVFFGGILIFPLLLIISFLVWVDSPGGIFYRQVRVGLNGRKFKMWKFRTMIIDADQVLENYLDKHPALREEWEATQKLKNDPRVTRVGRILRKLSLDELPQLLNILVGDMSLVGPRPFFPEQRAMYGKAYNLYKRVRPGLTGMWQVSGRNATTFAERAQWDEYYVRQWSIWLDIYVLLRTILVVFRQDGAY